MDLFGKPINISKHTLDLLTLRQELIVSNIANVETPGYKSRDINFKELLQNASKELHKKLSLKTTHPMHIKQKKSTVLPSIVFENNPNIKNDLNDVDIDRELNKMTQTTILYKSIIQGIIGKLSILENAVRGGRR